MEQKKTQGAEWQEKIYQKVGVTNGVKKLVEIDDAGKLDPFHQDKDSAWHLR